MLKDEFELLKELFHQAAEGKNVKLEEVFAHSLSFFEQIKEQVIKGTPEEKRAALEMMNQMYSQMKADTKAISEKSGMSAEQLAAFGENPANFTKQQWEAMRASKEQIQHVGEDLAKVVEKVGPIPPAPAKSPAAKDKLGKKSKWMRS
jgi:hypothetical protein